MAKYYLTGVGITLSLLIFIVLVLISPYWMMIVMGGIMLGLLAIALMTIVGKIAWNIE